MLLHCATTDDCWLSGVTVRSKGQETADYAGTKLNIADLTKTAYKDMEGDYTDPAVMERERHALVSHTADLIATSYMDPRQRQAMMAVRDDSAGIPGQVFDAAYEDVMRGRSGRTGGGGLTPEQEAQRAAQEEAERQNNP